MSAMLWVLVKRMRKLSSEPGVLREESRIVWKVWGLVSPGRRRRRGSKLWPAEWSWRVWGEEDGGLVSWGSVGVGVGVALVVLVVFVGTARPVCCCCCSCCCCLVALLVVGGIWVVT